MVKKTVLKYAAYLSIFGALALAEKSLGLYGAGIGFLFAVLFCREKIYISLPCFFIMECLVAFSLRDVVYASGAVVLYVIDFFIHRGKKLRYSFAETALLSALSMAPYVGLNLDGQYAILRVVLSVAIALATGYVGIIGAYPVLVRGLRYKPSSGEIFCMGILVALISVGIGSPELFNVKPYFFAIGFALIFLRGAKKVLLPFGIASAIGASIGSGEALSMCAISVAALVVAGTGESKLPVCAISACGAFLLASVFFSGFFDIYSLIPFCAGVLCGCFIPQKALKNTCLFRQGYVGRYAMRTVVNRDREDVAGRIENLSSAFCEMRDILAGETEGVPSLETVSDGVCRTVCAECPFCGACVDRFDVRRAMESLVKTGAANGKATMLDVSVPLCENCRRLGFVIAAVNDGLVSYKKLMEKRSGAEQGRDMIIAQIGGMSVLLKSLSESVKMGLSFDVDMEKQLAERLAQANIIASDVMLYRSAEGAEATVVVREKDAKKAALPAIVSQVLGIKMNEFAQKAEINGMVGISFCKAPKYKIMYGESVFAKENRCGDTRQAVKIGKNKVMFVLSDGMGTGRSAQLTAGNVIYLIETFYKAGFDHRTIFTSVSGLLALRTNEDFSALDVAVVDLATGDADFIKQGGRESFVLSGENCYKIEGGSLPMGILADSVPNVERRRIAEDETVVLMSDGVADALGEEEIREIALNAGLCNPKAVADEIVACAVKKRSASKDDMTVMALRLVRA